MSMSNLAFTDDESPSDVDKFVRDIKQEVIHKILPSEKEPSQTHVSHAGASFKARNGKEEDLNFQKTLDDQNALVAHLKKQFLRSKENGSCNEALKRDLTKEVQKLRNLVDHFMKHHQILNIQEDFELETALSEEKEFSEPTRKQNVKIKSKKLTRKASEISSEVDCKNLSQKMRTYEQEINQLDKGIDQMNNKVKKIRKVCCTKYSARKSFRKSLDRQKVVSNLARKDQDIQDLCMKLRVQKCEEKPIEENKFLREMNQKMKGEIHYLKIFVMEQKSQIKIYQNKYLNAQQISEEQTGIIRKMQRKSEQMEDCVKAEITRIRQDFQRQMHELSQENRKISAERDRLRNEYRKKRAFQDEMEKILPEYERLQREEKCWLREKKKNLPGVIAELQEDIQCWTYKYNKVCCEKEAVQECLVKSQAEVEKLREDAVQMIERTKNGCLEVNKSLREELAEMEEHLAQCRAAAKIALNDRDNCIRELQCRMSVLKTQFQEAQLQIENVRGHISRVTNEVTGGKTMCKTCDKIL